LFSIYHGGAGLAIELYKRLHRWVSAILSKKINSDNNRLKGLLMIFRTGTNPILVGFFKGIEISIKKEKLSYTAPHNLGKISYRI
jgi:hypothetical protein